MSYYLLDHPSPSGPNFYTSRRSPIVGIVIHITAGAEDTDMQGEDVSAENTAAYAARTTRTVSWHSTVDSDSIIPMLPDAYTAFHVRNYNSSTLGIEICKRDVTWADEPADWVEATLLNAAKVCRRWASNHNIPVRHVSKAQLDKALSRSRPTPTGFIGHSELDPSRRRDPGPDFPWDTFFDMIKGDYTPSAPKPKPTPPPPSPPSTISDDEEFADMRVLKVESPLLYGKDVEAVQVLLKEVHGLSVGTSGADGYYGNDTAAAVERFQSRKKIGKDRAVGPVTRTKLNGG